MLNSNFKNYENHEFPKLKGESTTFHHITRTTNVVTLSAHCNQANSEKLESP